MERKSPTGEERKSPTGERASGAWKQFKGKIREKWGDITDDELDRIEGRREQLVGYLQERSGKARQELEREVDDIARDTQYRF